MGAALRGPDLQLPWHATRGEDERFRSFGAVALLVFLALSLVIPFLPVPEFALTRSEQPKEVLVRIQLQPQPLPTPLPEPVKPPAVKKPEPKPEVKPKPVKPEVRPQPVQKQPKPVAAGTKEGEGKTTPVDLMQQARDTAAKSGVLAFRDELQAMRESIDVSNVTRSNLTRGVAQAERTERSVIAARATGSSGGISTAAMSRDTGGVALSGRETTRIDTPAGMGGGTGNQSVKGSAAGTSKGDLVAGSDRSGGRSDEQIRRVMDQNKGALFAIYNRALRDDPALQGKLVFEMVIDPSGSVAEVKLISSQLADSALTNRILARIRMINFGAANVLRTRVNYSLDFLPF
jgi:outer membrane biosynthesis protein TonB